MEKTITISLNGHPEPYRLEDDAYQALRPLGQEAVRVVFAQEMERALRRLLESGATAELPVKATKKRRRNRR